MKEKCLLIVTKDHRRFLTQQKNLPSLIEFVKTFGAEVYLVQTRDQKILELKSLADAICNPDYDDNPECDKLKRVYPPVGKDRATILKEASKIKAFILDRFLTGKEVSLTDLKKRYKDYNVTDACLCNHLSVVRKTLAKEGKKVNKLGGGRYCIVE